MDINTICTIPEKLLDNVKKDETLSQMFANIDRDNFIHMMSHMLCQLLEDQISIPHGHKKITFLQSKSWMSCYLQTLEEVELSQPVRDKLIENMRRMNKIMIQSSYQNLYDFICVELREKLKVTNNPDRLLTKIKDLIEEEAKT